MTWPLPLRSPEQLAGLAAAGRRPDPATETRVRAIVEDVRMRGENALRGHARKLDGLAAGAPLALPGAALAAAAAAVPAADLALLQRTAARIRAFAEAQRRSLSVCEIAIPGGRAGQRIDPVAVAGCYAPGGRFPLPSSVLMTAVTARTAGVATVVVASPRPTPITLAAAHVAGADVLLQAGGAQAIAALALGVGVPRCDVLAGPGNRYVAAAKRLLAGECGIDLPAGPSELVVLADGSADPAWVAADLLAQAEHDPDARPFLLAAGAPGLIDAVQAELQAQLAQLPTAAIAGAALHNGGAVACADLPTAVALCDLLAPEHLQLCVADPDAIAGRLQHYGALFLGHHSAEVLGDYGAGPNHVLPTGGAARFAGGLSVLHFLRVRTWLRAEPGDGLRELLADASALARLEGLPGHARSAELRRG